MLKSLCYIAVLLVGYGASAQRLDNTINDKDIKSLQFYLSGGDGDQIDYPIKKLRSRNPIRLEFDWMGEEVPYFMAKLIHCDQDWSKSVLNEVEYLENYNEFQINDFEQSSSTFVPYFHVEFDVPNTKITGNFVLVVYDEEDPEKIYLTRRFVIFDNQVKIMAKVNYSNVISQRNTHHQIDLSVNYSDYEIRDPQRSVHVSLLQNGRWDNAKTGFKPNILREHENRLIYDYIDGRNNFMAGNEFRAFDTRSIKTGGMGVKTVNRDVVPREFSLYTDQPLDGLAYTSRPDIDGQFVIQNFQGDDDLSSDYAKVHFELEAEKQDQNIYIFGQLSDWDLLPEYAMTYDENAGLYRAELFLKQGHYNYLYAVRDGGEANVSVIDGSHNETVNTYIVLVYHRPFGVYYDKVVGYKVIE